MSKRLKLDVETQDQVNVPGKHNAKNANANKADEVTGQSQDEEEEKSAESMVMFGTIPHVLERILSFLPVSNLKQYRLVSTDWNKAAVVQLRKDLPYLEIPLSRRQNWNNSFRNLLLLLDNEISPFAKFSMNMGAIKVQRVGKLLNTIAPSVTHLDFDNGCHEVKVNVDVDPNEIFTFPEFPLLTNLYQRIPGIYYNQAPDNPLRSSLFWILEKSPKLKNLKIGLLRRPTGYIVNLFLSSLENKNNAYLKQLDLYCNHVMTEDDFSRLCGLGLTLNSLRLRSRCNRGRNRFTSGLVQFLRAQTKTLEFLEIWHPSQFLDRFQPFPCMKQLKELKLMEEIPPTDLQLTPSINYHYSFPSLKKLNLAQYENETSSLMPFLPDASYPAVQSVEALLVKGLAWNKKTESFVLHAAQYFPNLKVLGDIPVNLKMANSIYKWLPQLKKLTFVIRAIESIDDIITGLSLERCAALRLLPIHEIRDMSVDVDGRDPEENSLRPLSSLKNLKFLGLKARNYNQTMEFSRVSTLLVLKKMPSLQKIDFDVRSRAYIRDMADHFQDLTDGGKSVRYTMLPSR